MSGFMLTLIRVANRYGLLDWLTRINFSFDVLLTSFI
jgi:hypothetical protein